MHEGEMPGARVDREKMSHATLDEALQESAGVGLVYKPSLEHIAQEIESRKLEGLDDETKKKLENFTGTERFLGHIFRLLSPERSETEHEFGRVLLDHYYDLLGEQTAMVDDEETARKQFEAQTRITDYDDYLEAISSLRYVPEGDNASTVMWWTFAPYLSKELHHQGLEDRPALERIMAWTAPAVRLASEKPGKVHLPGLEYLSSENGGDAQTYILSKNKNGASHRFTEQKAKELIAEHVV
ncbi:MAG: hypothetical protein WC802_03675 [Patescibacteria group bacterium]|jgi:hypothetical protein